MAIAATDDEQDGLRLMGTSEQLSDEPIGFEPVTRATLSSQVREQLLRRISEGSLAPGARLPSERDLSEQFGVARTSVREAMQGLISLGVVERRGNRSHVVEHLSDVNFNDMDSHKEFIRQLFETRRLLELPMIGLAAERASEAQRKEIVDLANQFQPGMPLEDFRPLDHKFHAIVARACGNPLLVEVHGKVMTRLFHSSEITSMLGSDTNREAVGGIVTEAAEHHRSIATAIANGDKAAAMDVGGDHLDAVERGLIDRLK